MQKIIKALLKLKKALQNYDADYIVIDVKAKFKKQSNIKKNK